jgi:NTE family protein
MKYLTAIVVFLFLFLPVVSQKVALVLSGGGAKGLAHVGVLKFLEEN